MKIFVLTNFQASNDEKYFNFGKIAQIEFFHFLSIYTNYLTKSGVPLYCLLPAGEHFKIIIYTYKA